MIELYIKYLQGLDWLLQTMVGIIIIAMSFIVPPLAAGGVIYWIFWLITKVA